MPHATSAGPPNKSEIDKLYAVFEHKHSPRQKMAKNGPLSPILSPRTFKTDPLAFVREKEFGQLGAASVDQIRVRQRDAHSDEVAKPDADSLSHHSYSSHLRFVEELVENLEKSNRQRRKVYPDELAILEAEYAKSANWS